MAGPDALLLDAPLARGGIIKPPMTADVLLLEAPLAPHGGRLGGGGISLGNGRLGGGGGGGTHGCGGSFGGGAFAGAAAVPPMAGSALACKLGWATKNENTYFGLFFAVFSPVKATSNMCGNCCKKLSSPPSSSFTDSSWRQTGGNLLCPCTFACSKWYTTPGVK